MLISVNDKDKAEVVEIAKDFAENGFKIVSTEGTRKLLASEGIETEHVNKLQEGGTTIQTLIMDGSIDLVVNTPDGKKSGWDDSYLRKSAIRKKVPYITTMAAAKATATGIKSIRKRGSSEIKSLQELHAMVKDKE